MIGILSELKIKGKMNVSTLPMENMLVIYLNTQCHFQVEPKLHILITYPLTPNDPYSGRTAPLTSKLCILYIYSTNIGTEYFKHGVYSTSFSLQNAVCFIILTYFVPVLFTFYIPCVC